MLANLQLQKRLVSGRIFDREENRRKWVIPVKQESRHSRMQKCGYPKTRERHTLGDVKRRKKKIQCPE